MELDLFKFHSVKKQEEEMTALAALNDKTAQFGLVLTKEEAGELVTVRNESLKKYDRVEFGKGILEQLVFLFCDSDYINQDGYLETLKQLQDIFYDFKNRSGDKLTDEELLTFMREQFDGVCAGDLNYLGSTCLENFTKAIKAGYTGYKKSGGHKEYEQFDEVVRWDKEVYMDVLKELFW